MKTFAIVAAALLVAAFVLSELLIPDRVASDVEARLTEGGGTASVEVEALPAARLLFGDGDRIEVRGSDLALDVEDDTAVLDRLDGFDQVDVELTDITAGPFEVGSFELRRAGDGAYTLASEATTSGPELVEFGADEFGTVGSVLGDLLGDEAPEELQGEFDVELDAELVSDDGRIEITDGGGEVAGYDVGPLAEVITAAVVSRL